MPNVRIVTDTSAHFLDPAFPAAHNVDVLPLSIQLGPRTFDEGAGLETADLFRHVASGGALPNILPPSPEQFARLYERLAHTTDKILSIHLSGKLSRTAAHARLGAETLMGRCKIQVIDSLSTSVGLGLLVEAAARAAGQGASQDEIVRLVRAMIPRLYAVFFTETLDYLANAGRLGRAQAMLGAMLSIKPFLTLEDGDLVPMEKVRTRQQALEKLVEFVVEFSNIEQLAVLQAAAEPTDDTRLLLERLGQEFPGRRWPVVSYRPSLAALLGPRAMGVVVFEREAEPE